jgi:probable F420-dependent oxidoreductase
MMKPLSLIQFTEGKTGSELVEATRRLERLGYHELWLPEFCGREPFATAGYLLASTERIKVSTGIVSIYAHDADSAAQGANTLAELSNGRFTLGLGVSHPLIVEPRGHTWVKPVEKMRKYLERIAVAPIESPKPQEPAKVIVAGHGPLLMRLAAEKADGLFLNMQPVETVRHARDILGPTKELHVTLKCVLEPDPEAARDLARRACAVYVGMPAYHKVWAGLGFEEADWMTGSNRFIDATCAWGDASQLQTKIQAYYDAGATHVVLYPCHPDEDYRLDNPASTLWHWDLLEGLALEHNI